VSTISVEHEWDLGVLPADPHADPGDPQGPPSHTYTVEVDGRAVMVTLFPDAPGDPGSRPRRRRRSSGPARAGDAALLAPMQGTVVKVLVESGAVVEEGDLVLVLEAMKMENHVTAHRSGVVSVRTAPGAVVQQGTVLCTIEPHDG
jgi:acetyl-CoA/propionyl-CoA carboxylase biotin carboxyl carrier protein